MLLLQHGDGILKSTVIIIVIIGVFVELKIPDFFVNNDER